MKHLPHILLTLALILPVAGCSHRGKVIPPVTMSEIFADMLITDNWVRDHGEYTRQADTTLLYDPIFKRYGYTFEDYDASLKHYIKDPTRLYKVLKRTVDMLTKDQQAHIRQRNLFQKLKESMEEITPYEALDFEGDSLLWRNYDTVLFRTLDSLTRDSILRSRFVADSLKLDSLLRDSLVRDSLYRDSLKRQAQTLQPHKKKTVR